MNLANQPVSDAINLRRAELAERIVAHEFARHPELARRYGKIGHEKCRQDAGYHLAYLAQAIAVDSVELFCDYVGWAKVMLTKRGVPAHDLAELLVTMRDVLEEGLPEDFRRQTGDFLAEALRRLPGMPDEAASFLVAQSPHALLAQDYLAALLRGERHVASQLILAAVGQGIGVRDLYLQVFQPAQYEIGRLWQVNQISVAQEHYCTAATQLIMSQLYPYIFGVAPTQGTLVATCVSGDLHEIGARMVCDFFELAGWRTYYLGANVPTSSVVATMVQYQATVLAISATITYHVPAVAELIAAVRRAPACDGVKILVGGYPFKISRDLWRHVGADGCADNAEQAIMLAGRLTGQSPAA